MSADDILYAPILMDESIGWRAQCQQIIDYTINYKYAPKHGPGKKEPAPLLALTLMEMCELYHEMGQDLFYVVLCPWGGGGGVGIPPVIREIYFDGDLVLDRYESGQGPYMRQNPQWSLRDLNLIPNTYSRHYVFTTRVVAEDYFNLMNP